MMENDKYLYGFSLINICLFLFGFVCLFLFSSCTAGISVGKANRVEQTVTNMIDSTKTTFSILPNK